MRNKAKRELPRQRIPKQHKKKEKERGDTLILTEQRKECYRNAKRCRNESENLMENEKQIDNLREKNTETAL